MSKITEDVFCPNNEDEWRSWLKENHKSSTGIWLIVYKKGTKNENLSWSQAVDQALCFGWIDSVKHPIDNEKYKQFFGPRKAKSNWSKINKDKVARLDKEGLLHPAGKKSITIAKENGSWTFLDSVEALEVPTELQEQFDHHPKAAKFYDDLSKSKKKMVLYWIKSAKREETRNKRLAELMAEGEQNKLPKQIR
ncbi:hypothetical protein GYB29_13120 [bacterium]|nr:hypothetical protein [bacterium]